MKSNHPENAPEIFDQLDCKNIWVREFTEANGIRFCEQIMNKFEEDPYRPIIINISSYGGEVDALFGMIDVMDAVRSMAPPEFQFFTVAIGKACSAGAALLAYGDVRFAMPNSRLMVHQVISGQSGQHVDNELEFKETCRMNDAMLKLLKRRCKSKLSDARFKAAFDRNRYFTPKEAKEFGLIDVIGYPKVIQHVGYEVRVLNSDMPAKRSTKSKKV